MGKGKNSPYEFKELRVGYSSKQLQKHLRDGWEVVAERGGQLGSVQYVQLRRARVIPSAEVPEAPIAEPRPATTAIEVPRAPMTFEEAQAIAAAPFDMKRWLTDSSYGRDRKAAQRWVKKVAA